MTKAEQAAWSVDMMASPGVTDEMRGVVTMPKDATQDAIDTLRLALTGVQGMRYDDLAHRLYRALYDHLRKPATDAPRKVKVECVVRIEGDKVCYCQMATPDNIREANQFRNLYGGHVVVLTGYYDAPKPATKTVEVWHVEYAVTGDAGKHWMPSIEHFTIEGNAIRSAEAKRRDSRCFQCVRVTGPHFQTVPA